MSNLDYLLKYSAGYVVVVSTEYQVTAFNKQWQMCFSNHGSKDSGFFEVVHPDDIQQFKHLFLKSSKESVIIPFALRLKNIQGHYLHVRGQVGYESKLGSFVMIAEDVTKISRLERTYSGLEKYSKIGSWEHDLETNELFWSNETFQIFEVDPKEFVPQAGQGIHFFHPDSVLTISAAYENLMNYGTHFDLQLKFITAKGRHRIVRSVGYADLLEGVVTRVFGTFQDVTESVQKGNYERQEKKKLEMAISVGAIGTWEYYPQTESIFFSLQWCQILGFEVYEVANDTQTLWNLIHFDDLNHFQTAILSCVNGKTDSFEVTKRIKNKLGQWLTVYTKGQVVEFDQEGKPIRLLAVTVDQTTLMATQLKLERAKTEVEKFFNVAAEMLCVAGLDGYFKRINPVFCRILEYSESEILARPFVDFLHPDDVESTLAEIKSMIKRGTPAIMFENRYRCKSGEYRIFSWSVSADTESSTLYCSVRDLTDQKQAQMMLVQSAKLASLGEMAAGIAHEINNPLAIIYSRSELLQQVLRSMELDPDKLGRLNLDLQKILDNAERIAKIVRGLRAFSRDSSADEKQKESVKQTLDSAVELFKERFKNHGIELKVVVENDLFIRCRAFQIEQVIINLAINAFDAIQNYEEKWLHINVSLVDEKVVIRITDSGPGISAAVVAKMMNPFFTTKEVGKGTGLGLSISRGIIEEHGGRLYYNTESKRTQFVIELPSIQSSQLKSA